MSVYEYPRSSTPSEPGDDAQARLAFTVPRRVDFDLEGALAAGRTAPAVARRRGKAPMAPPNGRTNLWMPLGPTDMFAPEYDSKRRNAGRVKMVAVHPDGGRLYAASGNGGVWFSPDGGANWSSLGGFTATNNTEINRPAQRHASGALCVKFGATAADDLVLVGTGEATHSPNGQPGRSLGGIGVLVATGPSTVADVGSPWVREAPNLLGAGCSRLAMKPDGSVFVVATTIGLFQRPAVGGLDVAWTKVAGAPFATLESDCTDVLWTASTGATPERLWVWVKGGSNAGLWVRDAAATDFAKVTTATSNRRAVLAAPKDATQIYVLNDRGEGVLANLFRVASPAGAPTARQVTVGVPDMVGNQGFYDLSVAVHPTQPDHVVLAGNTFDHVNRHGQAIGNHAAIVAGDVVDNAGTLTFGTITTIGVGVHADVHHLTYSNDGARLWATCDGGVYRSDHPTSVAGFVPRNHGLSIAESNYVACHPKAEGFVIAGLQDNGVIMRSSNGVWAETSVGGDGGGVVFDPLRPDRFFREHSTTQWSTSDGTLAWDHFPNLGEPVGAFYSTPAAIAHRRGVAPPAAPNVGQLIFGTTRVWYSENFGTTWTTLPTGGADPLLAGNTTRDSFGEDITVCRWQHPDVAWILGEGRLERYSRTPGSDTASSIGAWTREVVIKKGVKNKKDASSADGPIRDSAVWTDIACNLDPDSNADGYGEQVGSKGALYMGTIGKTDDEHVDTLWWFNGTDKWFATGLRTQRPDGVPAPVTAIVCDPAHPEEVWVGTTVGVWRGIRTLNGGNPPTWVFAPRNNGLPEAAVEDLAIFSDGGLRILRAAIAARGVWELRLDVSDVTDLTFVRAHDDDLRYRTRAIEVQRDLVTARSWHGSPDVRPRRAPADVDAPATLPWQQGSGSIVPESLRRFQAALRSKHSDLRVRPDGKWDFYFNEVLRDLGAPALAAAPFTVTIDETFWTNTMAPPDDTAAPWTTAIPTEADLFDLSEPAPEGTATAVSMSLPAGDSKVEVLVHHRGLDVRDGADVRVAMLKWIGPATARADDASTWFTGPVPWAAAVNDVLNSSGGTTAAVFADNWSFIGSSPPENRKTLIAQTIDNFRAGVASFNLSLTGLAPGTVVLLVAVVRAGADSAITASALKDLALTDPHVAVRSLTVT